ncbi:MAG: metalloregulator ArsR/SmtB family transcription factor [Sedimentisphaerales bacterium]|nr:metalloregulator ArsR/SmtB family transcription factor [Sedimentisphaerales bacterium]
MAARNDKQVFYRKLAQVYKGMAHPVRVAVLDYLRDGEQCVCDIARHVGSERSNVSRHLAVMVACGVLESRKEGLRVLYRIRAHCVAESLDCITRLIAQQARDQVKLLGQVGLEERS